MRAGPTTFQVQTSCADKEPTLHRHMEGVMFICLHLFKDPGWLSRRINAIHGKNSLKQTMISQICWLQTISQSYRAGIACRCCTPPILELRGAQCSEVLLDRHYSQVAMHPAFLVYCFAHWLLHARPERSQAVKRLLCTSTLESAAAVSTGQQLRQTIEQPDIFRNEVGFKTLGLFPGKAVQEGRWRALDGNRYVVSSTLSYMPITDLSTAFEALNFRHRPV